MLETSMLPTGSKAGTQLEPANTSLLLRNHPLIPSSLPCEVPPPVMASLPPLEMPAAPESSIPDRDVLYAEMAPLVQRLLYRYGKTPELRQDLEGEIYCRFCRLLENYDPNRGIPIRPYIVRMLQQTLFNYVRDYWRYESRVTHIEMEPGTEKSIPALVTEPDLVRQLVDEELLNALPSAIALLPERQKIVLVWRFYDGISFDDIAERLGIQPATARSLLRHALKALRRQVKSMGLLGD